MQCVEQPGIGPHKDTLPTSGLASARTPLGARDMLIQLMPSAGLCWLEGRQQTCLIKLLLLPGGKMF
jgi:hypothetical protein